MKSLTIVLLFISGCISAQTNSVAQFAIWKPKEGHLQNFENGYKQHLNWHKINGDKWSWYGWYVVSGTRYGQFIDATFDHTWADFDKAIKPAEDFADNMLHVLPFADFQTAFKVSFYPKLSTVDTFSNKLKLIKFVTLTTTNIDNGLRLVNKLKEFYTSKQIKSFKTYQVVDGGATNQILLLMGFDSWEEYSVSETFNEKVTELEQSLKMKTIGSINAETMIYRADMSLFPNQK